MWRIVYPTFHRSLILNFTFLTSAVYNDVNVCKCGLFSVHVHGLYIARARSVHCTCTDCTLHVHRLYIARAQTVHHAHFKSLMMLDCRCTSAWLIVELLLACGVRLSVNRALSPSLSPSLSLSALWFYLRRLYCKFVL